MCEDCQKIAQAGRQAIHVQFPHLRLFYERYSDDLLTHFYHICHSCHQIWREDDSDYPADAGYFWNAVTVDQFLSWEADKLPADVEQSERGVQAWVVTLTKPYSGSLF